MMDLRTGLRALVVGAVMLCGAAAAEAATWQLPLLPSGSFTIEGEVTEPTVLEFRLRTAFPADNITNPLDFYSLQSNINLAVSDPATGAVLDSVTLFNNRDYFSGFYPALTQQSFGSLTILHALRTITFFQQDFSNPRVFSANGSSTFLLTLADDPLTNLVPDI